MVTNRSCACATPLRRVPTNAAEKTHAKDLPSLDALLLVVFWLLERLMSAREFWSLAGQLSTGAPLFRDCNRHAIQAVEAMRRNRNQAEKAISSMSTRQSRRCSLLPQ